MKITGAISVKTKAAFSPLPDWFGDRATVTASYSHRDYSAPFDRGTIFDLNTGHAVNVDRKPASMKRLILPMAIPTSPSSTPSIALTRPDRALRLQLQPITITITVRE